MHPELKKILDSIPGYSISVPPPDIQIAVFHLETLIAKIETLETFLLEHISEKENKEFEEIKFEYEELLSRNLADIISQFLSKYAVGFSDKNPDEK